MFLGLGSTMLRHEEHQDPRDILMGRHMAYHLPHFLSRLGKVVMGWGTTLEFTSRKITLEN
jgi:hypothetical protein